MTVATAPQRAPAAPRRASRPPLTLVGPAPYRPPLAPFILVSVLLVVVGLVVLLLLNTLVNQDSFRVGALEHQATALNERAQVLSSELARLQSPSVLAARAQKNGLVPAPAPAFLRVADGRITGTPVRAVAPPPPPPPPPPAPPAPPATAKPGADGDLVEVTAQAGSARKPGMTAATRAPARSGVLQEVPSAPTTRTAKKPGGKPVLEPVTTQARKR